jgi:hypothetical protein
MEAVQTLSLSQKDGPVLKFTVRSHDIVSSQPYDPFDFSTPNDTKDTTSDATGTAAAMPGAKTLGRGASRKELKTPHGTPATPSSAYSEADRKRLLHRRGMRIIHY